MGVKSLTRLVWSTVPGNVSMELDMECGYCSSSSHQTVPGYPVPLYPYPVPRPRPPPRPVCRTRVLCCTGSTRPTVPPYSTRYPYRFCHAEEGGRKGESGNLIGTRSINTKFHCSSQVYNLLLINIEILGNLTQVLELTS